MMLKPMLFLFLITLTCLSCNNEELFVEPTAEVVDPDPTTDPDDTAEDTDTTPVVSNIPCTFSLAETVANSTVIINCIMDLEGQTVTLPANVTLVYDGGDIINGTLIFSENSVISGELLNSSLTLGGSNPLLKDPSFTFIPERWEIVEGEVPQDIAFRNTTIVNDILVKVKTLGVTTFKLDSIDAYFYGNEIWRGGIEIPSNMNFEMTDNTHLRVHLTSTFRSLIFIGEKENIKISGGNLHGNRNLPGFDISISAKGERSLIVLKTGVNITMENIHLSNSAVDGINIESMKHAYEANYVPSQNIIINNCTFDSNRRNNLSITDGLDMLVENCTFLNAGVNMEHSDGIAPRFGIDLEPHVQDWDKPLQHLERVTLRNNVERGSAAGGIVFADGDYYVFEQNDFEGGAHIVGAANVQIINNTIGEGGITHGDDPGNWYTLMRNENNVVAGNTITGKGNGIGIGINAVNKGLNIYDNHIINMGVGIMLRALKDSHIYNNTIESSGANDDGINALIFVDNVVIENNNIKVNDFLFYFDHINYEEEYQNHKVTVNNNIFNSTGNRFGFLSNSTGIDFLRNEFVNGGARITGGKNVLFEDNAILQTNVNLEFNGDRSDNLLIKNNIFSGPIEGSNSNSSGNKNIKLIDNSLYNAKDWGVPLQIIGFDGVLLENNTGSSEISPLIIFKGNNSTLSNNINSNVNAPENIVEGINNIIN
ncbi:hypothetical protein [Yeosuana sp. AK3]